MLNIIDEFTHECLAIRVSRRLKSIDVIDVLSDLFILRGVPGHIRSDNVLSGDARALFGQQVSFAGVPPVDHIDFAKWLPPRKESLSAIATRVHRVVALTVLKTRCNPSGRPEHYLQGRGRCHALTALQREGSSTWHRRLREGPVICSGLDQRMSNPRHLGGDSEGCLAPQILVLAIFGNMPAETVALKLLSRWRIATWAASQKVRRKPSVAVLRQRVCPRNCPD